MKKIKSIKNLQFKKEVISSLNLRSTKGGAVGPNTETMPMRVCNSVPTFCITDVTCPTAGPTLCYTECDVCC
jgi:hypothetical protein